MQLNIEDPKNSVIVVAPLFWFSFEGETDKDYKIDEDFFLMSV